MNARPFRFVFSMLVLPCVPVLAGDAPMTDPVEILKKVDAATKAVKAARYEVVSEGLGDSKSQMPEVKAKIAWMGSTDPAKAKFRADMKIKKAGSDEVQDATVVADGENFLVLDHAKKLAYEDIDPAVMGSFGRAVRGASIGEFGHPKPFEDEINGKKQELRGTQKIGDEECYEIHVVYGNENQQATWCFSTKRFIPLRRIDAFTRDGKTTTIQKTLANVVIEEKISDDTFKVAVPAGYEKKDDFAP